MKILANIFFVLVSALIVYFHHFIGEDFTQMSTIIDFVISTIACSILFKLLILFANLGNKSAKGNHDKDN